MLAAAGIYLVLDVNSPSPNQHINRYEPWLSYNLDYLEHVFKVVEQFSYYNNTLGFFAGNEIVNDRVSSKVCLTRKWYTSLDQVLTFRILPFILRLSSET